VKIFTTYDRKDEWEFGIAPGRHSALLAFRSAMIGIWPRVGSFHLSAFAGRHSRPFTPII